jgi:phosphoribosylformimino-5-aminoimidazole carboxamide ribotide isomerase
MIIIPAIDIIGGKVVRLYQGDFNKKKFYSDDPVETALMWQKKGAGFLHIVDLDGARHGEIKNGDIITRIIKAVKVPCEVGGGLRDDKDIEYFLQQGAKRVVLGTRALEDINYLKKLVSEFKEKIIVSIDFRNTPGGLYVEKTGWSEKTHFGPLVLAKKMQKAGVGTIVVTDISKDGTLAGPNIKGLKEILEGTDVSVISSGGISGPEDIKKLRTIGSKKLEGVIIGRALYEGRIDLEEAIKIAGTC